VVAVSFDTKPHALDAMTKATKTVPIGGVELESDPVAKGWVASLARPGGNVTGFFLDLPEMSGKQLQLLKEVKPTLARVAVLGDPGVNELQFRATEIAARSGGLTLQPLPTKGLNEIPGAIAEAARWRAAGAHFSADLRELAAHRRGRDQTPASRDQSLRAFLR